MKGLALALLTMAGVAGCLGGGSVPPRQHYVLQDRAPAEASSAVGTGRQSLVVAGSAADLFYNTESLVFSREPGQLAYYQFASWTDRPAHLVVRLTERRLAARGRFASVTGITAGVRPDLVLDITVMDFYHDAVAKPAIARVEFTSELIDWRTRSLLARHTFSASAPVHTDNANGAVDAFNHAVTEALDALVPWVEEEAATATP